MSVIRSKPGLEQLHNNGLIRSNSLYLQIIRAVNNARIYFHVFQISQAAICGFSTIQ